MGIAFCVVGRGRFELPKSETSDLQSDPFGHSGIFPYIKLFSAPQGSSVPAVCTRLCTLRRSRRLHKACTLWMFVPAACTKFCAAGEGCSRPSAQIFARRCAYWRWSRRLESNPQPADYKSAALPVELHQHGWCLGAESNHRHRDFQSLALPTELPRHFKACLAANICYQTGFLWKGGDPERSRTVDLQRDRLAF